MTQLERPKRKLSAKKEAVPHVAVDVFRIATGISNAYIVQTGHDSYVLVDAGDTHYAEKIAGVARKLFGEKPPDAILLTHGHFDHAGGVPGLLRRWPNTPVYAHPMEFPYLQEDVRYPPGDPTVGGAMAQASRFMDSTRPTRIPINVEPLPEEGGELPFLPGWELRASPGHTPGHVSLWHADTRTLIAGDALSTLNPNSPLALIAPPAVISQPPPYATYNWNHARQSVRALAELEPFFLCAGHGRPMHGYALAKQFSEFAKNFPVPSRGRYVRASVRFNKNGPTFIPPAPLDYVKHAAIAGTAIAAGLALFAILRPRKKDLRQA